MLTQEKIEERFERSGGIIQYVIPAKSCVDQFIASQERAKCTYGTVGSATYQLAIGPDVQPRKHTIC